MRCCVLVVVLGVLINLRSSDARTKPKVNVSDAALATFAESLWAIDDSNVWNYVKLDLQGKQPRTSPGQATRDLASRPLFKITNETLLGQYPPVKTLRALFNNYKRDVIQAEVETKQEQQEIVAFINAITATNVMKKTHAFLSQRGWVPERLASFKTYLRHIWFDMYSRARGRLGSSGFEHVFLGEIKNGQVSGFHNWLYFAFQEVDKVLDYRGYSRHIDLEGAHIVKNNFFWHGKTKPLGSMYVGTSPEYEMAIYTACFLLRPDNVCKISSGGYKYKIKTNTYKPRNSNSVYVGTAFPLI